MSTRGYTILGWIVWQLGQWFARRKMRQNRGKLAANHPRQDLPGKPAEHCVAPRRHDFSVPRLRTLYAIRD